MNCIVVDDEPLARSGMQLLIKEVPMLNLIGEFSNVIDADNFLRNMSVDLIFMDIQMPNITGLEYLKMNTNRPMVVITTAYPQYAIDGFDLEVVDYLTKPIRFERFFKAVSKCLKIYDNNKQLHQMSQEELLTRGKISESDYIFIRSNRKYIRLNFNKISHIEAIKDYVLIYYENEKHPLAMNLKAVEVKLNKSKFIRVNKSYIINIDFINSIEGDLITLGKYEISIGETYKDEVLKVLLDGKVIKREY